MGLFSYGEGEDSIRHHVYDVVIIGGGLAGLSAAIYLGRSQRNTLLIHSGHSMAKWEHDVQNYLGFPDGIDGGDLLARSFAQVSRFGVAILDDEVHELKRDQKGMFGVGAARRYAARRVLLATGLTHLPPDIPGTKDCLGKSLFFCKDCDAYRVQGRSIVIIGRNNEAAEYALSMLLFSSKVLICTNGKTSEWDRINGEWLDEYSVPVTRQSIRSISHEHGQLSAVILDNGESLPAQAVFTTRGDVYHHDLAAQAGARLDDEGQIIVDHDMKTSVSGLYAAGCVTPANCQMIIAAGQGATAGQAINRDLFKEDLRRHALPRAEQAELVERARCTMNNTAESTFGKFSV
jgi:thioredoxin reductase (NADPH)